MANLKKRKGGARTPPTGGSAALLEEHAQRAVQGHLIPEVAELTAGGQIASWRLRAVCTSRLDWYFDRMLITDACHAAGMRFRHLYHDAHVEGRVTAIYERDHIPGDADDPLRVIRARRDIREAMEHLPTEPGLVVVAVAGHDEWAGSSRRLSALRNGLGILARFWRLEEVEA